MAVAHRQTTAIAGAAGTTRTFTVPGTAVKGDTLCIAVVVEGSVTIGLPSGGQTWTQKAQTKQGSLFTIACFELANWNGTDTTYTVAWGGSSKYRSGTITAISGTDTTTPTNATSGANFKENTPASKNAVVDGPTTTVDNCLLFSVIVNWEGRNATAGSGWTEDGDNADVQVAHKTALVAKGAQSSVTHTYGANAVSLTLMLAFQPPAEGEAAKRRRFASVG